MKRLWYENRFNPKKKGLIYDYGNYAAYITENMKGVKVVIRLSTAERELEKKGYEFIGEETEEDFKRRRDGFLYEKFENGERKIAAIQQPEYKGPFEGWYQSKDKSGKTVSVGPYETKEQVERVIREQGFMPVRRDKGISIGGTRYRSKDRNSRAEVYPGGQDEYGRDLFRVELREDNGHVEELYMTRTKLNRWLDQFGFKPDRQVGQARKSKKTPRLRGRDDIDWWVAIEKNNARRTNSMLDYSGNKEDMLDLVMAQIDDYAYNHNDSDLIKSIDRAKTAEDLFKREGYISKDKEEYSISDIGDKSFEVLHVTAENFEKLSDIYPDIYDRFKDDFEEDIDY